MSRFKSLAVKAALALAVLGLGGTAHAAVVVATFFGTVVSGEDDAQAFQAEGYNLAGKSFVALFTYDSSRGGSSDWDTETLAERSGFDADSPVTGLFLSIGSSSRSVNVDFSSIAKENGPVGGADSLRFDASNVFSCFGLCATANLTLSANNMFDDSDFRTTFTREFAEDEASSAVNVLLTTESGTSLINASIHSVAFVTTVPEPGTWALLILGHGLLGARLRKRQTLQRLLA